jgi:CRP/FNR family transcriptional regulator, cyclic AMP receptor protein
MNNTKAKIKVTGWDECPLYWMGDTFILKGNALIPPDDKPTCILLAQDISLVTIKSEMLEDKVGIRFECRGCGGKIFARYSPNEDTDHELPKEYTNVISQLSKVPFFESLGYNRVKDILSLLKLRKVEEDEVIIAKGDPGENLYIIVSGGVQVVDGNGVELAELGDGEIFGEMSLVSGDPVAATIKVVKPTTILYMNSIDFKKIIHRFPSLQMYISCLLARRLAHNNILWSENLAAGMAGKLNEISPSGLFQILNLNQKTGVLQLFLHNKNATVLFKNGEVIDSKIDDLSGKDAFFALLKESEGRYQFDQGLSDDDNKKPVIQKFMGLLMEGLQIIDEEAHH